MKFIAEIVGDYIEISLLNDDGSPCKHCDVLRLKIFQGISDTDVKDAARNLLHEYQAKQAEHLVADAERQALDAAIATAKQSLSVGVVKDIS